MHKLTSSAVLLTLFTGLFFLIVMTLPYEGVDVPFSEIAGGIFAIYVGFAIANSRERLNKVNELLKIENANNLLLYRLSASLGEHEQQKMQRLLDQYLMDQVDYILEDFNKTEGSFFKLYTHVLRIEPRTTSGQRALDQMLDVIQTSSTNRSLIETVSAHRLSKLEWTSTLSLLTVVIGTLYWMSDGTLIHSALITVLAASAVLLVLVLRDLNNLKWQKDIWTWKPLHDLFKNLGLIPYYPGPVVRNGEANILKGETIRIAEYPEPYPNMEGKVVDVITYEG